MPDLRQIFRPDDPGFLRLIAKIWGVENLDEGFNDLLAHLKSATENDEVLADILESLPKPAHDAFMVLVSKNGKIPWADFSHKFGRMRDMGAARRDRERPDLHPESISEMLFFKGLVGKVFLDEKTGPMEFVFVPDEILLKIQDQIPADSKLPGKPANPKILRSFQTASDSILQDACSLITLLRLGLTTNEIPFSCLQIDEKALRILLRGCGLIDKLGNIQSAKVKEFLELPHSQALFKFSSFWRSSQDYNDLLLVKGLLFESNPTFDPLHVKEFILQIINRIPSNTWWELSSFIEFIHSDHPTFLRPSGDYDSWFIRDAETKQYLQGFETWKQIEGNLIESMISQSLHWLGYLDLAFPELKNKPVAFRLSPWWHALLNHQPPVFTNPQPGKFFITRHGKISAPFNLPLTTRYQIGRFAQWIDKGPQGFSYQISHRSLKKAKEQGLKINQLKTLIKHFSSSPLPPSLEKALQNWDTLGPQASFDRLRVIRFSNPAIVKILLGSKAANFIKESINPTTIAYDPAGEKIIKTLLLEAGYFSKDD
jgi:hypothetical protein